MYTVTIPLITSKNEDAIIHRRYGAAWHIHTVVVKYAQKQLNKLVRDRKYIDALKQYKALKDESDKDEDRAKELKPQLKALSDILKERRSYFGLTKKDFDSYVKGQKVAMQRLISSSQAQAIAEDVYQGVESVLFGKGKHLHIKKAKDVITIPGKNPTNGARFYDPAHTQYYPKSVVPEYPEGEIEWLGLHLKCKINRKDEYVKQALKPGTDISYCTIKRMMFEGGYRYYVILTIDGEAPKKQKPGTDYLGIDPGVSSVASISDHGIFLEELAPDAKKYMREIARLQCSIDRSLRISDPQNYNEDGTPKKGKHKIHPSKTCQRKMRKIKMLYRKQAASTECSHNNLANRMIREAGAGLVEVETMDYPALAKRSKELTKQDRESKVTAKDGTVKTIRKYKRRKRFGLSVRLRARLPLSEYWSEKSDNTEACSI